MSGKAPPTGPRALTGFGATSSAASSSSSSLLGGPAQAHLHSQRLQPANSSQTSAKRIPTGPRSLTAQQAPRNPPPGPKAYLNGHVNQPTSAAPSIPNGLISQGSKSSRYSTSINGKHPETVSGGSGAGGWQSGPSQSKGWQETNVNGNTSLSSGSANSGRAAISISLSSNTTRPAALPANRPSLHIHLQPRSAPHRDYAAPPTEPPPILPPPPPDDPPPPPPPPSQPPPAAPPPPKSPSESEPPPAPPSPFFSAKAPLPSPPPSLPPQPPLPPSFSPPPLPLSEPTPPPLSLPRSESPPPPPVFPRASSSSRPSSPLKFSHRERHRSPPPRSSRRELGPRSASPSRSIRPSSPYIPTLSHALPPRPPSPPSRSYSNRHTRESTSRPRVEPEPEPPKLYSLPPLPDWPPPRSEYPHLKNFKILYDPAIDANLSSSSSSSTFLATTKTPSYYRHLIEHVRKNASSAAVAQDRIKGKGKGKEVLFRFEGEVVGGTSDQVITEEELVIRDPRLATGFKKPPSTRTTRNDLHAVRYEYDENSTGPPPPTGVLFTNLSHLTSNQTLYRHLTQYGQISSFERQIDNENGMTLGIAFVSFETHEEAKKCVEKENGRKGGLSNGLKEEEWKVVFDGEKLKLQAVLKELNDRKQREKRGKANGTSGTTPTLAAIVNGPVGKSTPQTPATSTPTQSTASRSHKQPHPSSNSSSTPHPGTPNIPARPNHSSQPAVANKNGSNPTHPLPNRPPDPSSSKQNTKAKLNDAPMPSALVEARRAQQEQNSSGKNRDGDTERDTKSAASDGRTKSDIPTSMLSSRKPGERPIQATLGSLSPSPEGAITSEPEEPPKSAAEKEKEHEDLVKQLIGNGHEYVIVEGSSQLAASVKDEDVKAFFESINIAPENILRDHTGLYVTFDKPESAYRASSLLGSGSGSRKMGFTSVTLTHHSPPSPSSQEDKSQWDEDKLIDKAQSMIINELKALLERDVIERIVLPDLKKLIFDERNRGEQAIAMEQKPMEKRGLKGLSFKKQRRRVAEGEAKRQSKESEDTKLEKEEEGEEAGEGVNLEERPRKKRKKESVSTKMRKTVVDEIDLESEEEDEDDRARIAVVVEETARKRDTSDLPDIEDQPAKKKQKLDGKGKKSSKKNRFGLVEVRLDENEFLAPALTKVHVKSLLESSLSPSRSPSPAIVRPTRVATPPPDPVQLGICEDEEDLYFVRLALSGYKKPPEDEESDASSSDAPMYRKHLTGSARTEGFYKIDHKEKAAYVAQYQSRSKNSDAVHVPVDEPQPQHVTSSRSNRANARRRAQGLEEINQVQRAVALSKGETAASELSFKFNQLQTRKKHLRFARSPIHDWGLYAMEKISRGEMVIEYVGEVIRAQVADKREKAYERQGIGSSYLFRIDEELVVDATKKGNLGRLINHSCDPNCTAKIIMINGEKKIVIYAKQDIELGEEITYDYHFPFEQDKIPCLCGSAKCRGYLN